MGCRASREGAQRKSASAEVKQEPTDQESEQNAVEVTVEHAEQHAPDTKSRLDDVARCEEGM